MDVEPRLESLNPLSYLTGEKCQILFLDFLDKWWEESDEPTFLAEAMELVKAERNTLEVSWKDVKRFNANLWQTILEEYYRVYPYLCDAVRIFLQKRMDMNHVQEKQFFVSFTNVDVARKIRELKTGTLARITGEVCQVNSVYPETIYGKLMDVQKIVIQEAKEELPHGCTPRTIDIILRPESVESVQSGDRCNFTGTLIILPDVRAAFLASSIVNLNKMETSDVNGTSERISEELSEEFIQEAVRRALLEINGITDLRPNQFQTVLDILQGKNIFKTAATGSGKTLPPCLVPSVVRHLRNMGFKHLPAHPHILFLTPLNSIRDSLKAQVSKMGIKTSVLSSLLPYDENSDVHFVTPESIASIIDAIRANASEYSCIVFDEVHQFSFWAKGFRIIFDSLLYGGYMTMLGVPLLLQTATATMETRKIIKTSIPEIRNWTDRIETPARNDIVFFIPPPTELKGTASSLITPHIEDLKNGEEGCTLVLVRSVLRGAEIFLQVITEMKSSNKLLINETKSYLDPYNRRIAFYHRNISEKRKEWILNDLSRHEGDPDKKLVLVVATVALGLGVDISVTRAVIFGLPEDIEGVPQEVGRVGRHSPSNDEQVQRNFSVFYYQKGAAENFHCKRSSTSRQLITPLPSCQTQKLYENFDPSFRSEKIPCDCCYSDMKKHFEDTGCAKCSYIINRYSGKKRRRLSTIKKIKLGIKQFCDSRKMINIPSKITGITFSVNEFSEDLVKIYDEIDNHFSLVQHYGVTLDIAIIVYAIIQESIETNEAQDISINSYDDCFDSNESSDSENSDFDTI